MLRELGDEVPYRHPPVWSREPTSGPERLLIGAGRAPVALLTALAEVLPQPLFVLVVLRVPRAGDECKLESNALTQAEVLRFFGEFGELFEQDGRAQAWVGATARGEGLLVLDEHDLVYAYGPLDAFEAVLAGRGYEPGVPEVPDPHEHAYLERYDSLEVNLRECWDWRRVLPLDDSD